MKKKFTLTELLVVVAIILMLLSLLLPSLLKSKKKAYTAVCASNLKQVGLSAFQFSMDHDHKIPMRGTNLGDLPYTNNRYWTGSLEAGGYLLWTEETMTCPSLPFEGDWSQENYVTYGAPRYGDRIGEFTTPYWGFKTIQVKSPSEFFWFADSAKEVAGESLKQWNNYDYEYNGHGIGSALRIHTRHSNKANLWFLDGHVAPHKIGSLKQLEIGYVWLENGSALNF